MRLEICVRSDHSPTEARVKRVYTLKRIWTLFSRLTNQSVQILFAATFVLPNITALQLRNVKICKNFFYYCQEVNYQNNFFHELYAICCRVARSLVKIDHCQINN
jgi:hypothetical protein